MKEIIDIKDVNHPLIIGHIYADWCIHCKMLGPKWEQMINMIKNTKGGNHPSIEYMDVEEKNMKIINEFNEKNAKYLKNGPLKHSGFPTIFRIKKQKLEYYPQDRQREVDDMISWFLDKPVKQGGRRSTRRRRRNHRLRRTKNKFRKNFTL